MRHGKREGLRDVGMREKRVVDLSGRDLLTTPIDHLIAPPGDREVAVPVQNAEVSGPEPSCGERNFVGIQAPT